MTSEEIVQIVNESLQALVGHDDYLLKEDVSERAITHRLAVHLETVLGDRKKQEGLSVDCEYNRNAELGRGSPKYIDIVSEKRRGKLRHQDAAEIDELALEEVSTFPDIIIHQRGNNERNELIIELKKDKRQLAEDDFDETKLQAFTDVQERNRYHYRLGVFIKLGTGDTKEPRVMEMRWFRDGQEVQL